MAEVEYERLHFCNFCKMIGHVVANYRRCSYVVATVNVKDKKEQQTTKKYVPSTNSQNLGPSNLKNPRRLRFLMCC